VLALSQSRSFSQIPLAGLVSPREQLHRIAPLVGTASVLAQLGALLSGEMPSWRKYCVVLRVFALCPPRIRE